MRRTIDLSPKMAIPAAENEFVTIYDPQNLPLGQNVGGLQMFSNTFKRGYGDSVFGSSEKGIWLGAADFENAPFKVYMNGNAELNALTASGFLTKDGENQELAGSIIAGGTVDGRYIVKDAGGNVIGLWDKDGLLIQDGKITVQTEDSISILDSKGLVSTTAFSSGSITGSGDQTTNSTSFVDATGLSMTFTLDRTQNVYIFANVFSSILNFGSDQHCLSKLLVDSTLVGSEMYASGYEKDTNFDGIIDTLFFLHTSTSEIKQLTSGSHTVKLQFKSSGGDDAYLVKMFTIIGYIILGN